MALRFIGTNVTLEEELRDALSPSARSLWNDMKPRGVVNLDVEVHHQPQQSSPHIQVRAEPVGENVSIEPSHFPYRLEKLRGRFAYSDGRAEMEGLRGLSTRATKITGRGHCAVLPEGGWQLHLENLAVDRLTADRDLMQALPGRLKRAVAELHPTGTFGLRGSFDLASRGQQEPTITSAWNLNFDLHQSNLNCGVPLKNINGGVTLIGGFDGQRFWSQAELNIDSVTLNQYQFTQIMGLHVAGRRRACCFWFLGRSSARREARASLDVPTVWRRRLWRWLGRSGRVSPLFVAGHGDRRQPRSIGSACHRRSPEIHRPGPGHGRSCGARGRFCTILPVAAARQTAQCRHLRTCR